MDSISQILLYAGLVAAFLIFLALRELFRARRMTPYNPDRGACSFNVVILLLLAGAVLFGAWKLDMRERHFEAMFPAYPHARYAPERESLTRKTEWIYVSEDSYDAIMEFYQHASARERYALFVDRSASTSRLLFTRDEKKLFLTIKNEGDVRVLYYSEDGSMRVR